MKLLKSIAPYASVFGLALLVRLVYNLTVARGYIPIYDAALYHLLAQNLVQRHCYCLSGSVPDISRPPLWPFLLAIVYTFVGVNAWYGQLFYCLLGSATCVLIALFAREFFSRRLAFLTGVIAALYCGLFLYDGWLYTEALYVFLLTCFAYTLVRLQKSLPLVHQFAAVRGLAGFWLRYRWAILSGLSLGLIALTRPNGAGFFALLLIWGIFLVRRYTLPWLLVGKHLLLIVGLASAFLLPWAYRNYQVSSHFILVSIGMGEVLSGSYNDIVVSGDPGVRGFWRPPPHSLNHDYPTYTTANDAADTARALTWIRSHISSLPYLFGLHFLNMWTPYTYSHGLPMEEFPERLSSKLLGILIPVMSFPVFFAAAGGLLVTWKRYRSEFVVIYLVLAFTILENLAFYGDMRFRAPVEPLLVLLIGALLSWLARVWPAGSRRLRARLPSEGQRTPDRAGTPDSDQQSTIVV